MRWRLTSDAYWSDGVLVESEALIQRVSPHVLVEDVAPGEIQNAAIVLVFGDEPRSKHNRGISAEGNTLMFILRYVVKFVHKQMNN